MENLLPILEILENSQISELFSRPVQFSTYMSFEVLVEKDIYILYKHSFSGYFHSPFFFLVLLNTLTLLRKCFLVKVSLLSYFK